MTRKLNLDTSTRSNIIQAIFDIAYNDGLAAVTLRKVADKAETKLGLLHYYFRTKDSLLIACVEALFEKFIVGIESNYDSTDTPKTNLVRFLQEGKEYITRDKKMFILLIDIWRLAMDNPKIRKSVVAWYQRIIDTMSTILDQGDKQGVFKNVDKDTVANFFVMFTDGIGVHWCLREETLELDKYFDLIYQHIYSLVLKKVGNQAARPLAKTQ